MERNYKLRTKSKAKRINILFKKYKRLIGHYYETKDFKEPVVLLMRNDSTVEFFENATAGTFDFTHTDGEDREIILSPDYLRSFPYGKRTFRGYICDENHPTPLPENPVVTSSTFNIAINKILNDVKTWKAKEYEARGDMFWRIFAGIALVIVSMAVYSLFKSPEPDVVQQAVTTTTMLMQNATYF